MQRTGLSFSLTMVVAGVVLMMTALSVIALSGSSLGNWFEWAGGQQSSTVEEADIRAACQDLIQQINQDYCQKYVDHTYPNSAPDNAGQCGPNNDGRFCGSGPYDYDDTEWTAQCGSVQRQQVPRSLERANQSNPSAYDRTATEVGCSWKDHYNDLPGFNNRPMVTVQTPDGTSKQFNCLNKGYILETTCPAQ